jgi:glycosyltransferase involved in cell wall biosynthesis
LRSVLLIAYHYPPFATSSGVQRTLSFSVHLRRYGWNPVVLTVRPGVYERSHIQQLKDIPSDLVVRRTFALDAARHLSVAGRYWSRLALPDRWVSWWATAVPAGLRLIQSQSVDVIWSTYPIATAHMIGATLAALTGRPWIADFRDPMVEHVEGTGQWFPADAAVRHARLQIEARAAQRASRLVFCTEGARGIMVARYPAVAMARTAVISNGFEERSFQDLTPRRQPPSSARYVLLHSGLIYAGPDRDPGGLMRAIRLLADRSVITPAKFELRLRDPHNDAQLAQMAREAGIEAFVSILPQLGYREALQEMLNADGLLLLQGETSNPAIPAKLYEYLRAARPILGCVHPDGETARTLSALGIRTMATLGDPEAIASVLLQMIRQPEQLAADLPSAQTVAMFSRERLTGRLAEVLDELV